MNTPMHHVKQSLILPLMQSTSVSKSAQNSDNEEMESNERETSAMLHHGGNTQSNLLNIQ